MEIADDDFIEYLCTKIEYERLIEAMKTLEPNYRDVMYQHFVMEIPIPQVAEGFNQSISATKKQLVRGKKRLLQILEGE